jgi:hypothetical protein
MDGRIESLGAYPMPGQQSAGGGYGGAGAYGGGGGYGTPGASGGAGNADGLLGLLDAHEGGGSYDTLYGHSQNGGRFDNVDLTKMTVGEVINFTNPNGEYGQWVKGQVGRVATPTGRYQVVGTTLRKAVDKMGISLDTPYNKATQDNIGSYLARSRLAGADSPAAKRAAMRSEWEGFKHVSDDALDGAIAQFEANGGYLTPNALGAIGPK